MDCDLNLQWILFQGSYLEMVVPGICTHKILLPWSFQEIVTVKVDFGVDSRSAAKFGFCKAR